MKMPSSGDLRRISLKLLTITAAMILDAAGVAFFVLPCHLIVGGVTGIAKIIASICPVSVSFAVSALEVLMLLLAFLLLGKEYGMSIILASVEYPVFLNIFERFPALLGITDDLLVASVAGGLLMGAALGLVIRCGSATGGTDVISLILHKRCSLPLAPTMYAIEAVILLSQVSFSSTGEILLGLLTTLICTFVMNEVIVFGNGKAQIMIFSAHAQTIRRDLLNRNIGITLLHGETGLAGEPMEILLSIVHTRQINPVKKAVQAIDPEAFMTVSAVRDVRGRGFTLQQRVMPLEKMAGLNRE